MRARSLFLLKGSMTLAQLASKFRKLTPEAMEKIVLNSLKKNEGIVTGMNTDQLWRGEDAEGKKLPEYSERSVQVFNKPPGPMRLFDEGDFYRGFFIKTDKFPVVFDSRDNKTGKIAEMLAAKGHNPDDIYGLQKENATDLARSYVLEDIQKVLR